MVSSAGVSGVSGLAHVTAASMKESPAHGEVSEALKILSGRPLNFALKSSTLQNYEIASLASWLAIPIGYFVLTTIALTYNGLNPQRCGSDRPLSERGDCNSRLTSRTRKRTRSLD